MSHMHKFPHNSVQSFSSIRNHHCFLMANSPLRTAIALSLVLIFSSSFLSQGQLQIGFYSKTCPNAEATVTSVVREETEKNPTVPPNLLRLHYHDCIVQGCDASVLIKTPDSDSLEYKASGHAGLQGFEVIDKVKARLEEECPGVVSCADIVALAARDSVFLTRGPSYQIPTGRRDGLVSNILDADNIPDVSDSLEVLEAKFAAKGLSQKDLVLLSGAHTIGCTACFFVTQRLYNFTSGGGSDPLINPQFLPELKSQCPEGGLNTIKIPLDHGSETTFDVQIFRNIGSGFGVIRSDAILYTNEAIKSIIESYLGSSNSSQGPAFPVDFADAVIKMGMVGVKSGAEGEIRRNCASFN